jgi:GT2 family glycosyltransferase
VDLRCRLFKLPYGDQAMFVTREALSAVGGIPGFPLMEDVALARSLAKAGKPFTLLPERVRTSPRRWQRDGIVRRTCKNWWLLLRYLTGVKPEKLAREY